MRIIVEISFCVKQVYLFDNYTNLYYFILHLGQQILSCQMLSDEAKYRDIAAESIF